MIVAATSSITSLRFLPRVFVAFKKPAADTVVPRSSQRRTGTVTSFASCPAKSAQSCARGPSVPFILIGWPTMISCTSYSLAAAATFCRTLPKSLSCSTPMGEARYSVRSQHASPVRASPKSTASIFILKAPILNQRLIETSKITFITGSLPLYFTADAACSAPCRHQDCVANVDACSGRCDASFR